MGVFDLVGKAAKGAKKAAPFFSKADVVLDELPRNKGLGNEFLAELVKKGAKPTELKERGIDKALKDKPKMTKAEVQKLFDDNPPPRVKEEVRGGNELLEALDQKAQEIIGDNDATFDDLYGRDRDKARSMVESDFGYDPETQYESFRTPGGENYREILLKLPKRGLNDAEQRNLMLYEADVRRGKELDPWHQKQYAALKDKEAAGSQDYSAPHFEGTPNILAHIRVQDFQVPNKGFAVINRRSGFKSEVFPTMEQAEAAMAQYPERLRGMLTIGEAQGKPKKVLLVDEIQSDWHQAGRNKGYKIDSDRTAAQVERELNVVFDKRARLLGDATMLPDSEMARFIETNEEIKRLGEQAEKLRGEWNSLLNKPESVPDAPFKKNWHELAMKRVLDYAAENGYDTVAITPGAEQAKRYDLSKQLDKVIYSPYGDGTFEVSAMLPDGREFAQVAGKKTIEEIEETFGKEIAQKMARGEKTGEESGVSFLSGEGLQVGGEGMKGFYDKILPDYLNNYGKKYGAQVGELDLITKPEVSTPQIAAPGIGHFPEPLVEPAQTLRAHRFDITPQLREEIKTKGQPMYGKVAMPALEGLAAGSGAATIGSQVFDENNEQTVQNPVHFTENPDAMLLELMQRN